MEQLTQNLKNGTMQLLEVPFPALSSGCVLVQNHYSLISAGTESKTVKDARLNLISKANARREEVKKVISAAKTFGIKDTYKMVMNKLDAPSALGYSCAGKVIAIAEDVTEFKVGDRVACGGNTANHAEVVVVPKNLCVRIDDDVDLCDAAYATLGAIALQGVRQADLKLGESCAVIGLGLVGQLTIQLLKASGVKIVGIDISKQQVDKAKLNGTFAIERSDESLLPSIASFSNGYGVDAVIITASSSTNDPVNLAGDLARKKGKVIIVGSVSTDFKRANYFKKELDLKMSCSYGPGRYDTNYEEKGIDYPIAYARWTENRNMQLFVDLLKEQKINTKQLTTHTFDFNEASKAYQLILDNLEPFTGVVLKYNINKQLVKSVQLKKIEYTKSKANIGFIGAGSFAQNFLLPNLKGKVNLVGVATGKSNNARNIADKFGFGYCAASAEEIVTEEKINTVFITTRHSLHANYVLQALVNGKNSYVEKPLCLTLEELEEIKNQYSKSNVHLMIGFNRRFAEHTIRLKSLLPKSLPVAINYRINAGMVNADHWTHDPKVGGGRIIGEVCHFIDLVTFIADSNIESLSANAMQGEGNLHDTLTINLLLKNGSVANIAYFANGSKMLKKEYLEVFAAGKTIAIDDFKSMNVFGSSINKSKLSNQDKGHSLQLKSFIDALENGKPTPICFDEIYHSTLATFKVIESIMNKGEKVTVG